MAASTTSRAWLRRQNVDDLLLLLVQPGAVAKRPSTSITSTAAAFGRKAEMECLFDRRQDPLVHQFHGGRDDARGDDLRDRCWRRPRRVLNTARRVR